jgi:hypothetical protein
MSNDAEQANTSALDAELSAAGLATGNTLWLGLAKAVMAAYDAYDNNTQPAPPGYNYVTSIWVQESAEDADAARGGAAPPAAGVKAEAARAEGLLPPYEGNTLFGFAAYAEDLSHNIIVLRGTVSDEEAGYDLYGWGTNTPCMLPSANPTRNFGNVKQNFYDFYTYTDEGLFYSLGASLNMAVRKVAQINPGKIWIVVAHSLGGPLATLGALDAYVSGSYTGSTLKPWLVTFGSVHLGVQSFATAFNQQLQQVWRFANLCDFVPSIVALEPPATPPTDPYVHVGTPCTFIWQKWDNWANHSMEFTYLATVRDHFSVIHPGARQYPQ